MITAKKYLNSIIQQAAELRESLGEFEKRIVEPNVLNYLTGVLQEVDSKLDDALFYANACLEELREE